MSDITERVKPGSFCRVAAVETIRSMDSRFIVSQITVQCGERGFQLEENAGANDRGLAFIERNIIPKAAILCAAMCIGCPNQIVAPTK